MKSRRILLLTAILSSTLTACPPGSNSLDGGNATDGSTLPVGSCTGGCGPNQRCDEAKHVCVDACGVCDGGFCAKNADGVFQCSRAVTSCGTAVCGQGQSSCVANVCTCQDLDRATLDSCSIFGKVCNQPYNPVLKSGGVCEAPQMYQACKSASTCDGGNCASCASGQQCVRLFGSLDEVCLRSCNSNEQCDVGDVCAGFSNGANFCLPSSSSLFNGVECRKPASAGGILSDGGIGLTVEVPVSNTCLLRKSDGGFAETVPSGNCTLSTMRFSNTKIDFPLCRPPGTASEGQSCRRNFEVGQKSLQCGTGLECVAINGDDGLCMQMCNAAGGQPTCDQGESCVNVYRGQGNNAVLGVCAKSCNVFADAGGTCSAVQGTEYSCVPVPADGVLSRSSDGSGFCAPVKANAAGLGEPCADPDVFKGSSCADGLVCNYSSGGFVCEKPCALNCTTEPAAPGCATLDNTSCPSGKTCQRAGTSSSSTLGFCR